MRIFFLICSFFLFVHGAVNAQDFSLTTSTSQGVIINRDFESDLFTATIQVTPTITFDRWKLSAVAMSYSTDEQTGFFTGMKAGYIFLPQYSVNTHLLFGNTGKQLAGGGITAEYGKVIVDGNASYEYRDNEVWLEIGIGYKIAE